MPKWVSPNAYQHPIQKWETKRVELVVSSDRSWKFHQTTYLRQLCPTFQRLRTERGKKGMETDKGSESEFVLKIQRFGNTKSGRETTHNWDTSLVVWRKTSLSRWKPKTQELYHWPKAGFNISPKRNPINRFPRSCSRHSCIPQCQRHTHKCQKDWNRSCKVRCNGRKSFDQSHSHDRSANCKPKDSHNLLWRLKKNQKLGRRPPINFLRRRTYCHVCWIISGNDLTIDWS